MTTPFTKGFSAAYKRARSQDSPTPLASPPVPKATKIEEIQENIEEEAAQDDYKMPFFLRQSQAAISTKFNDLVWKEKFRIWQGKNDPSSQWVQEVGPHITKRNRYINVQPWEKSRIHLLVGEGKSDYINASPILLRDPRTGVENKYIATQVCTTRFRVLYAGNFLTGIHKGPKQTGLSHFWQMVWQETTDVAVIVMLTETHDGATEKCFQYFPLNADAGPFKIDPVDMAQCATEGSVTVSDIISDSDSKIQARKLLLRFGDETKDVWHFLFSGWPDFAVPEDEDRAALLELLKLSKEKNSLPSNPRIIHCSAGVGRSGTFIALDHLLTLVDSGAIADTGDSTDVVYDVVNSLREQRMLMVQMEGQYRFLYEATKEQYQQKQADLQSSGNHSPKLRKLARGMKATLIGDTDEKDGVLQEDDSDENLAPRTEGRTVIGAQAVEKADQGQVEL